MTPTEDIGRAGIARLVPHQGTMCLLDRVLRHDERAILAGTASHRRTDNPLRRGNRLPALALCEYGAQAMALHGGLLASARGAAARPGMLVSLRDVHFFCRSVESLEDELLVQAERLAADGVSLQYTFEVRHRETVLARGRAAVVTRPA